MKHYLRTTIFAATTLVFVAASATVAHATVGGPTVLYDFRFDPKINSVYYTEQSYSGKGCPPELKALSIATGEVKTIYSCDEGIDEYEKQQEKISAFVSNMAYLTPIHLKKNDISITVDVGEEEKIEEDWVIKTNMAANVFQDGVKKISFPFSGCSAEQPVIVDGYRIPGAQDKMLLLFSTKSDCFEGGYVGEFFRIVSGITLADDTHANTYKSNSPLIPTEASLVVYPGEAGEQLHVGGEEGGGFSKVVIISSVIALIIGLLLGRLSRR